MDTTFWVLAGGLVISYLGLGLQFMQIRSMRKARATQLSEFMMHLLERWESDSFAEAQRVVSQYRDNLSQAIEQAANAGEPHYFALVRIANFFENLGRLVDKRYLPRDQVMDLFEHEINDYYPLYKEFIEAWRIKFQDKDLYKDFQNLATKGDN